MYFLAPGRRRTQVIAREVGDGVYEATLSLKEPGVCYVHVAVPSMLAGGAGQSEGGVRSSDITWFTLTKEYGGFAPPEGRTLLTPTKRSGRRSRGAWIRRETSWPPRTPGSGGTGRTWTISSPT